MRSSSNELYITTDNGSYGRKGFVSNVLEDLFNNNRKIDRVYAIGPVPMMKVVAAITKVHNVKTTVSLDAIMIDGTGMCGACRVSVDEMCIRDRDNRAGKENQLVGWCSSYLDIVKIQNSKIISNTIKIKSI